MWCDKRLGGLWLNFNVIWNPDHLDRIRQNTTYVSEPGTNMYVSVHTCSFMYLFVHVHDFMNVYVRVWTCI